jgi:hypothetical protein
MRLMGQRFTNGIYFYAEAGGGTILVKDRMRGKLYVKVGSGPFIPIYNGANHVTAQFNSDWQAIAAETILGVNKLCWFHISTNSLYEWTLNSSWEFVGGTGAIGLFSPEAYALEVAYQTDLNRDGIIGSP